MIDKERFARNMAVDGIGEKGQQRLQDASVLVVGTGGLGSPVLYYLAAAGIGSLGVMDYDVVDISNLQRQLLHFTEDIGRPKVLSAERKLKAFYPELNLHIYQEKLTESNAADIITKYDFVVECCDNYEAKFLINDICVKAGKAYSHAAVLAMQGEVMTYVPGCACYRCVFGGQPPAGAVPTSAEAGIIGSIAGIAGTIQATEVIKYITGTGELLTDQLLVFDGRSMQFTRLKVAQSISCDCQQK